MTQQEKRIKIAESCGWTWETRKHPAACWHKGEFFTHAPLFYETRRKEDYYFCLPDYFSSIDACHEMENGMTATEQYNYATAIAGGHGRPNIFFSILHATAAQRAEAYGLTMGLWKEGE